MKCLILFCLSLSFVLSGCSSMMGGADYSYTYQEPDGKQVSIQVHTNREVSEGLRFVMNPETGEVEVMAGAVNAGPNTADVLGQALIKALIAAYGPATPPAVASGMTK